MQFSYRAARADGRIVKGIMVATNDLDLDQRLTRLCAAFSQHAERQHVQDRLLGAGAIAHFMDPAQMGQRVQQDYTRWGQLIRDKGIATE